MMIPTLQSLTEIPFNMPGSIYRSPMPFTDYDNFDGSWESFIKNEIDTVVILAETCEILTHAKIDLLSYYRMKGLEVLHYPIEDYKIPQKKSTYKYTVKEVIHRLENGNNILVHCLAGIGRTGILLSCLAKVMFNLSGEDAVTWIRNFIPNALENKTQEEFVRKF
jgi:protein tyrosine phosphatase